MCPGRGPGRWHNYVIVPPAIVLCVFMSMRRRVNHAQIRVPMSWLRGSQIRTFMQDVLALTPSLFLLCLSFPRVHAQVALHTPQHTSMQRAHPHLYCSGPRGCHELLCRTFGDDGLHFKPEARIGAHLPYQSIIQGDAAMCLFVDLDMLEV